MSAATSERVERPIRGSCAFRTRQVDDPHDFVRTYGTLVEFAEGPVPEPLDSAFGLPLVPLSSPPSNCARGKVAVLRREGGRSTATSYQLSECGDPAEIVGCSNATAAAGAQLALTDGRAWVSLSVDLPGRHTADVDAHVTGAPGGEGVAVCQTWDHVDFAVRDAARVDGRDAALCLGPLNNYLIVQAGPGEDVSSFSLSQARDLWQHFGLDHAPLLSRIAFVGQKGGLPQVRFFTCGEREHPSAPLTGLAVLALAGRQLDWLALGDGTRVETPLGPITLPRARTAADGAATLEFPPVIVRLGVAAELPASATR